MWKIEQNKGVDNYKFFRFEGKNLNSREKESLNDLVLKAQDDLESNIGKTYVIDTAFKSNSVSGCFLIWCSFKSKNSKLIDLKMYSNPWKITVPLSGKNNLDDEVTNTTTNILNNLKVLVSDSIRSSDRDFSGLLTDEISLGFLDPVVDLGFNITKEGNSDRIKVEGLWDELNQKVTNLDIEILLARTDNFLNIDEMKEWNEFYTKRAFCKPSSNNSYLNLEMDKEVEYYSPVSSLLMLQFKEKGLKTILKGLGNNQRLCKKNCQRTLKKIKNKNINTAMKAQRFTKKIVRLLRYALGKKLKNLGCIREMMQNEKDYWLITKTDNPLLYSTPVTEGKVRYFSKEIGKYQGPSFLKDFKYKSHYKPIILRDNLTPEI